MKVSHKKKGASLIMVLIILAISMILSSVVITTISRTTKENVKEKKSEDLLYSSESGLQYGIAYFNKFKNNFDSIPKDINLLPPKSNIFSNEINSQNVDVRILYDEKKEKYIIKSIASSKEDESKKRIVSIEINKTETPGNPRGNLTIRNPFGIVVPILNNIQLPTGANKINDIRNILTYEEDKNIYNLYRTYWPRDQIITKIGKYEDNIEINYYKANIADISINIENTNVTFENSSQKQLKQKNANDNNITIYTVENGTGYKINNGIMYVDGDLKITSQNNQTIDQDLSKIGIEKIIVKGNTSIESSGTISLNKFNIETKTLNNNTYNIFTIKNSSIKVANDINISSNATTSIDSSDLLSKNLLIKNYNMTNISSCNIITEAVDLQSNSTLNIQNSIIKSIRLNVSNGNEFLLYNSTINSDDFKINTSSTLTFRKCKIETKSIEAGNANNINLYDYTELISESINFICNSIKIVGDIADNSKGYTKIAADSFNIDCRNSIFEIYKGIVMSGESTVKCNELKSDYSGWFVKGEKFYISYKLTFNQSTLISELVNFYNTQVININNNGLDKSNFDSIIDEINKYLPSGTGTPGTVEYEIDNTSLKYE